MHLRVDEVAPLAPLLIPLAELLVWALALAICLASGYIVKAFFGVAGGLVAKIPVVGGWLDSGVHSVEQRITNVLSGAAASLDQKMGAALHQLAREIDWLGREIRRHANLLETIATVLLGTAGLNLILSERRRIMHALAAAFGAAERAARHAFTITKQVRVGIGHDVLPRIRSLDREISRTLRPELGALREREAELEHGAIRTWDWILRHPKTVASTAFAGAVAWALARVGASWIRCNPFQQNAKALCRSNPGWWEDLLAGSVLLLGTLSFVEFVKDAQAVETEALDALRAVVREIP